VTMPADALGFLRGALPTQTRRATLPLLLASFVAKGLRQRPCANEPVESLLSPWGLIETQLGALLLCTRNLLLAVAALDAILILHRTINTQRFFALATNELEG
jgi:hypothetical protein